MSSNDAKEVTYSIVPGDDSGLFQLDIDTNEIQFIAAPDYEMPLDQDEDNIYKVTLNASDEIGNTDSISVAVQVTNEVTLTATVHFPSEHAPVSKLAGVTAITGKLIDGESGQITLSDVQSVLVNGVEADITDNEGFFWTAMVPIVANTEIVDIE